MQVLPKADETNRIKAKFKAPLSEYIWPIIWIKVYRMVYSVQYGCGISIQNLYLTLHAPENEFAQVALAMCLIFVSIYIYIS